MLDLAALKAALAPIEKVGKDELIFEVEGHTLTLRPLLPREEVEAQRYAQESIKGDQDDQGKADRYAVMSYFDTFQTEVLSYALVQVDALDLRDEEYIATGEVTQAGKPTRVPRHVALRKLLSDWSRSLVAGAWTKYTELLSSIEEKAATLVEYTPSDLDAEIDRVEGRLKDLKAERERRTKGDSNLFLDQVKAINEIGQQKPRSAPQEAPVAPSPDLDTHQEVEAPVAATTASMEEEWATFDEMPTPADLKDLEEPEPEPDLADLAAAAAAAAAAPRQPVVPPSSPPPSRARPAARAPDPMPDIMDSFGDVDDNAVLAAEEARILAARARAQQERAAGQGFSTGRVPPHRRGGLPDDEELRPGLSGGEIRAATPEELAARGIPPHLASPQDPTRTAVPGRGVDVGMERDTETLSGRGRERERARTNAEGGVPVNQGGDRTKAANPNFRPPGGR